VQNVEILPREMLRIIAHEKLFKTFILGNVTFAFEAVVAYIKMR
jgi:hypothetical protein